MATISEMVVRGNTRKIMDSYARGSILGLRDSVLSMMGTEVTLETAYEDSAMSQSGYVSSGYTGFNLSPFYAVPEGATAVVAQYTCEPFNPNTHQYSGYSLQFYRKNQNGILTADTDSVKLLNEGYVYIIPENAKYVRFTFVDGEACKFGFFRSTLKDVEKRTSGIIRTGWNYMNDETERTEKKYWAGTVGNTVYLANNSSYDAVLIPAERAKYISNRNFRFAHLLDKDMKVRAVYENTDVLDNTSTGAVWLALSVYRSSSYFLQKEGENAFESYHATGVWDFDVLGAPVLHTYMPPEVCCAVGTTIELYNNLVCLEADSYNIDWECSVGVDYGRKFSVTGTANNVGTYDLTMNIYDNGLNKIASLVTTLKIVAASISSQIKVVPIGDSLTNRKAWMPEIETLSSNKIAFIGTRGLQNDTYHQEGRSGYRAAWYNSDREYSYDNNYVGNPNVDAKANPFWDGTKFSMSHYIDTQAATIGTPQAAVILLGTNGLARDNAGAVTELKTMVDNILADCPTMPVFVCNTIYRSKQDGYYSTGGDAYVSVGDFQRWNDVCIMDLQNRVKDTFENYTGVYVVPMSVCMDRDYDFGNVETPVNPRLTTVTTTIPNESVHPQNAGYMQMADALWSSMAAHLS